MLGAIAGDIIGSPYEFDRIKTTDFELFSRRSEFTDDTVLTVAVAEALLDGGDFAEAYRRWGRRYPHMSWGGMFRTWLFTDGAGPYNSLGNGSAMRVAPVGWALDTVAGVLREAERTALPTHNHPQGVIGAQAVALAVFLARTGVEKDDIRTEITGRFGYDLSRTVAAIRPGYRMDETCPGTVPEALTCFLEAEDFEETVRLAVSLGGDADTLACIAGSVAEAHWGVPEPIAAAAVQRLDAPLLAVVERFRKWFQPDGIKA